MNHTAASDVFRLDRPWKSGPIRPLANLCAAGAEQLLALRSCNALYRQVDRKNGSESFPAAALGVLGIRTRVAAADLDNIPKRGPTVLVANHPFGGLEGLILMALLERIRPDVKILANQLLARIPELQQWLIPVDPFNQPHSAQQNLRSMRRALHWVNAGGALLIFPAGEVSSLQPTAGSISDPPWHSAAARILQRSGATAVPVYFPGRNSLLFQAAGLLHPRLRTALLPRELLNKQNRAIELRIGGPITPKRQADFPDELELTDYLRRRTYFLASAGKKPQLPAEQAKPEPPRALIAPLDPARLQGEIDRFAETNHLLASGPFDVYVAESFEIPLLLNEIGRLRELTFRAVGEGTGARLDLDPFDHYYQHLFIWQRETREIVGAYRLGATDRILPQFGTRGLYTNTLFRYQPQLLERISPGLEMGRSFIRPEYQKTYSPLLLLWKGIGSYIARHPRYRYLFGPVSISRAYRDSSRQLMTSSLTRYFLMNELAALVEPRLPVNLKPLALKGARRRREPLFGETMEGISELVADLEEDRKGIPVLLRQYLNLGGRLLAFNLDPQFSNVVDGLVLVDLLETDQKQLVRYLGSAGSETFRNHHTASTQRIGSAGS
jgi:putative hemolysin